MKKIILMMLVVVMASFANDAKSQYYFGIYASNARAGTLYIEDYHLSGSVSQTGASTAPSGLPFDVYSIHLPGGYGAVQGAVTYWDRASAFKPLTFNTGSSSYVSVYNSGGTTLSCNVTLAIASGGSTNSGSVNVAAGATQNISVSNLNKTFTSLIIDDGFGNPPNIIFATLN